LYLLITMLPFALLAPVVGPVLDHFRHGRRYALAVTMLGRAFLAYMISEHLTGFTLYPAAFGALVLSRAYGVARSAAVPRLLPPGLGLSEAGARASLFGTFAGLLVLPIGLLANAIGPEWPLRLSMVAFIFGMVTALRLPPRADSDPPEAVPRPMQRRGHKGAKVLSGRIVITMLAGSAMLRALYGFLTLYMAFAIKAHDLPVKLLKWTLSEQVATVVVVAGLGVGTFLATAIGTRLRIHRPAMLQAIGVVLAALTAIVAASRGTLLSVALLCLVAATASGLAKLANDAVIQERIAEPVRASAFAHSETLQMVAWVAGGAVGLIPFTGRWGLIAAAVFITLAAMRAVFVAFALRREKLAGAPAVDPDATTDALSDPRADTRVDNRIDPNATTQRRPAGGAARQPAGATGRAGATGATAPTGPPSPPGSASPPGPAGRPGTTAAAGSRARPSETPTRRMPAHPSATQTAPPGPPPAAADDRPRRFGWRRRKTAEPAAARPDAPPPGGARGRPDATKPMPVDIKQMPVDASAPISPAPDDRPMTPPGFTLYRPSGLDPTARLDDEHLDPEQDGRGG
jgi:MFS family permease